MHLSTAIARMMLIGISFTTVLSSCFTNLGSFDVVQGNGNIITRERQVATFTKIENATSLDVEITTKAAQKVELTTDENIHDRVIIEVLDGRLIIRTQPGIINPTRGQVKIAVQTLDDVRNTGSGDITASPIDAGIFFVRNTGSGDISFQAVSVQDMTINSTGSGNTTVRGVTVQNLITTNSGSGNISMQGSGTTGSITLTGSGDFNGRDFVLQRANARTSGSGSIRIGVSQSLEANVTGSGSIIYYGNPMMVTRSVNGSGSITRGN
jgi:hypothetical protein